MSDAINLNKTSPTAFNQPTQPVSNTPPAAPSSPTPAVGGAPVAPLATTTAPTQGAGTSAPSAPTILGDGLATPPQNSRVPDIQSLSTSGGGGGYNVVNKTANYTARI